MEYCVIKNTTKVIDGSENPIKIMLKNALNAGFAENEVEILTEEEYQARVELEPKPIAQPTMEERLEVTEETLLMLMDINLMGGM